MSIIDQNRFADNFPGMWRKHEFGEQSPTDYNSLNEEQKAIIAELIPHITYLDSDTSAFQDIFTGNKDQFHLVKHVDRYYLVDTQGYDYCRYTIYLENFDPSKKVEKTEKTAELIKEEKKYEFEKNKAIQLLRGIAANMSNLSEDSKELSNEYNIIEMIIHDAARQIEEIEK